MSLFHDWTDGKEPGQTEVGETGASSGDKFHVYLKLVLP